MLRLIYARENTDKEKFIFDRIRGAEEKGFMGRTLLIVPDQFTLDAEKALFNHLGRKCLMDIEVISMSRLGFRLLEELGGSKRTFIDKYGRHMILSELARENHDKLQIFRGLEEKASFINFVNDFISELKQYDCSCDELLAMGKKMEENSYVQKKLEDLYLLYSEYEKRIEGKYTDSEDYIDLYLEKISESEYLRGANVWVYGFDSFAPKALKVLGEIMQAANNLSVVLTYDDDKKAADANLFALSEIVMENLEKEAESRGVESKRHMIGDYLKDTDQKYLRKQASSIFEIEKNLYAVPFKKVGYNDGLKLVRAANLYNEAESAACYCLKLVRDESYRLNDIRLICNDQDERGPILRRIFKEYGIELFSDQKKSITESPISQAICGLLDVVSEDYRTPDLMNYLKLGLNDLTSEEVTDLENYAIKYRVKGSMWKKPFIKGELEYGLEELGRLNLLREKAVVPFEVFEDEIKDVRTNSEFVGTLYAYLYNTLELPEKIAALSGLERELGREDLADETEQVWGKVLGILDQMAEISGAERFELKQFAETFKVGLSQVEIGILPPTKDGILMGTSQRTRTDSVRALIVVGANEGVLPSEAVSKGLFTGDEKDLFKDKGMELLKVDSVKLLEERMGIYRNFSKPSEKLYVSYSVADSEGNEAKESSVFTKLRQIFPNVPVENDVLNSADTSDLVNAKTSGLRHMTEALNELTLGHEIPDGFIEALDWFKKNKPEEIQAIRRSIGFTNKQEELGRDAADALFRRDTDEALSLSPSRLERFSKCPFSHLILYGLKADERRSFEVAPREIGDVYHACLMKLTETLTEGAHAGKSVADGETDGTPGEAGAAGRELTAEGSPWMTITYEETGELVSKLVQEEIADYREGVFKLGTPEMYRADRLSDALTKVAWNMIEQVRAGQIVDAGFEKRFGRGRDIRPIEIETEEGTVYIEGIIDRVDYLRNDRVKIIDYKTGNEKFDSHEAEEGYRLQLMLYLKAALEEGREDKDRKPAGIFYFHVHEPLIDMTEKNPEKLPDELAREYKLNGVIVNDPAVISGVLGDFSGYSKIASVSRNRDGNLSGSALMEEAEFKDMSDKVDRKVYEIVSDLVSGKIDISPMKSGDRSACTFCNYKGICRFDTIFSGCKWRVI